MAISYVGQITGNSTGGNITLDLTPLSMQEGDLVIVLCGWESTTDGDPGVVTSGYIELLDLFANDTRDANLSVNRKVMGSTPDTSVECLGLGGASNATVAVAYVLRGADSLRPIGALTSATGTNSATVNPPSVEYPVNGLIIPGSVIIACGGCTTLDAFTATEPSGYFNLGFSSVKNTNSVKSFTAMVANKPWSSGSEDPGTFGGMTGSSLDSRVAGTFAVLPQRTSNYGVIGFAKNNGGTGSSGTVIVDLTPIGLEEEDLIILAFSYTAAAPTNPGIISSGWTEILDDVISNTSGGRLHHCIAYKIMGSTPDTSVEVDAKTYGGTCIAYGIRGVDIGNIFDNTITKNNVFGTSAGASPALTVGDGDLMIIGAFGLSIANTNYSLVSGFDYQINEFRSSTVSIRSGVAHKFGTGALITPSNWSPAPDSSSWCAAYRSLSLNMLPPPPSDDDASNFFPFF